MISWQIGSRRCAHRFHGVMFEKMLFFVIHSPIIHISVYIEVVYHTRKPVHYTKALEKLLGLDPFGPPGLVFCWLMFSSEISQRSCWILGIAHARNLAMHTLSDHMMLTMNESNDLQKTKDRDCHKHPKDEVHPNFMYIIITPQVPSQLVNWLCIIIQTTCEGEMIISPSMEITFL